MNIISSTKRNRRDLCIESLWVGFFLVVALYAFFWKQIGANFYLVFGDQYDAVIEAFLVSHWHWVLQLKHPFNNPNYFYPFSNTLGYNDGYLLYGVVAAFFRGLGFDLLRSAEFVHVVFKLIGYLGMYALLRIVNRPNYFLNAIYAAIFVDALSSSIHAGHGQLFTLGLAPVASVFLIGAYKAVRDVNSRGYLHNGVIFVLIYSLWLMTSFYMAFFYGLFLIIFTISYLMFDRQAVIGPVLAAIGGKRLSDTLWLGLIAILAILPFLMVYIPQLFATGGHAYSEISQNTLKPLDVFNISNPGWIWGSVFVAIASRFPSAFGNGEHVVGFTPVFFAVFCWAAYLIWKNKTRLGRAYFPLIALVAATAFSLVLGIDVDGYSLWSIVYYLVPGGRAVRVVARYYIFLIFPVTLICAYGLDIVRNSYPRIVIFLALFVLAEQIIVQPPTGLNVKEELQIVEDLPHPPASCKAFFSINPVAYGWGGDAFEFLRNNVQAMLIADKFNLPTINGNASFSPAAWNFGNAPREVYLQRVRDYIQATKISDVCGINIKEKKWFDVAKD